MQKKENSVLFASRAEYKFPEDARFHISKIISNKTIRKNLMWENPIVHSTVAFRKEDYFKTCGYMSFKYAHDYSLFIELLKIGQLSFSDKITVNYYVSKNSLSRINPKECLRERFMNQWKALFLFSSQNKLFAFKVLPILIIRTLLSR